MLAPVPGLLSKPSPLPFYRNKPSRPRCQNRRLNRKQRCRPLCATAPQVTVIGEALYGVKEDMLANDFDVPREKVTSWTPKAGGAPSNVAGCLAKLGVPVILVSALGDDDLGHNLVNYLKSDLEPSLSFDRTSEGIGVDTSEIALREEPTRDVYVTRTSDGERQFVGFGREADQYADCHITLSPSSIEKIKASEVLLTGTLGLAFPETGESVKKAISIAKNSGVSVFIDVNWRPVMFKDPIAAKPGIIELAQQADIVKLTNEEAEWMFGIDPAEAIRSPQTVLEQFQSTRGVLVTAGGEGAAYCFRAATGLHSGFVEAFKVEVVDTTGAGDAFSAGFIYSFLKQGGLEKLLSSPDSIDDSVLFASASGGYTASALGALEGQPSSPSDVIELINEIAN